MTGRLTKAHYTERALAGLDIPPFVFVPRLLRPGEGRLNVKITQSEIIDNHKRIAEADPLGFIVACMNGQPIPHFEVKGKELQLTYRLPDMETRMRAAEWLGNRITFMRPDAWKKSSGNADANTYDAMVSRALADQPKE